MKIIFKLDNVKYTAQDPDSITWSEALTLVRSVLVSAFPYLTDEDIANHFTENTWSNIKTKDVNDENA